MEEGGVMRVRPKRGSLYLAIAFAVVAAAACAPAGGPATTAPGVEETVAGETLHVGITNEDLTREQVVEAIQSEGQVVVANWTYTGNDVLVREFQEHIAQEWGVDITLVYEGTQAPSTYMTNVFTAIRANNPAPYDVMAIEENYWAEGVQNEVIQDFLPSDLIPNAEMVQDQFKHGNNAIGFQATATPAVVYNSSTVDFLTDWTDLADPRLQGKLTMPLPGDITSGGFILGVTWALGGDYQNPEDVTEAINFIVDDIGPNVVKWTTDSAEMQQLLRSGGADAVGFWNSLARLEFLNGYEDTRFLIAESGMPMVNGFMWVPKDPPHPVLAQLFINWRLSPEAQVPPDDWGLEPGPWAELHEGFLGPDYEQHVPDWIEGDYNEFFPTSEEIATIYKQVDWDYYAANVEDWMDELSGRLGL